MTIRKQASRRPGKGKGRGRGKQRGYGALPPRESQRISLATAVDLTQRFRKASPPAEHGGFFWVEGVQAILSQPNCVGLRYYHGLANDGQYRIVLVGVDKQGNDIVKAATRRKSTKTVDTPTATVSAATVSPAAVSGSSDAVLLDNHWPCPPYCPDGSPLV